MANPMAIAEAGRVLEERIQRLMIAYENILAECGGREFALAMLARGLRYDVGMTEDSAYDLATAIRMLVEVGQ